MKKAFIKSLFSRILLAFALVTISFSETLAAWPDLLGKRDGGEVSFSFYVVMTIVILVAIILAILTTRETNSEKNG
jgi:hypothetical protein